ncbi:hypothetical protein EJ03DRAFT_330564 [Teratosphaeria nubilosa]|uniref:Uncharacterized protein n=1 Tax=Teratosphaeria nubilosa TaxID=161662 RepID=A0A6G1L026_9PEZI|nr:hypothetical protein EJ03DRAFT_330564 [Teratosphaeria nubilosa]
MARPSKMKTPKTPAARPTPGDDSLLSTENGGRVAHLAGGLVEGDTELLRDSPAKHTRSMGAHISTEEACEVVRATAAEIDKMRNEGAPRRSGKLRRVSKGLLGRTSISNPPYQNPARGIKRLGPSLAARPDTYAVDISPDKDPRKRLRREVEDAKGISPLRKQKKQKAASPAREWLEQSWDDDQERANQQLIDQQQASEALRQEFSSPRRSRRQQEKELSTQDAREKQWFPDPPAGPPTDPPVFEPSIPLAEDAEPQAEAGAIDETEAPEKPSPRKTGRPKRNSSAHAQLSINVDYTEQSDPPQDLGAVQHDEARNAIASAEPIGDEEMYDQDDDYQPSPVDHDDSGEGMEDQREEDALSEKPAPAAANLFKGPILQPEDMGYSEVQSSPARTPSPKKQVMRQKKRKADAIENRSQHAASSSKKVRANPAPEVEAGPSSGALFVGEDEVEDRQAKHADIEEATGKETTPAPPTNDRRLYGQWTHLRNAFRTVNDIGVQHLNGVRLDRRKFKRLNDQGINTIINVCNEAIEKLRENEEVAPELTEIADRVDALYKEDEENKIDLGNLVRIKAIYAKLVPRLLALLKTLVVVFEDRDGNALSKEHMKIVINFMKVIMDLEEGAKEFVRPPSELALIQPNYSILSALKKAYEGLRREVTQKELQKEREEQERRYQEERARDEAEQAEEEHIRAEVNKVRRAWNKLHTERLWAEAGIMSKQKQRHLRVPELEEEIDQDGQPFIREQVFHPRIGPPPALVQRAKDLEWSTLQLEALDYGLRKFAGPHVFIKLMREYCGKGRPLNDFSVTEIVTTAAMYKDYMAELQMRELGRVEEWVATIPNWVRGQGSGQENVEV